MAVTELDGLIHECFADVAVDKGVSRGIGTGERAIPAFVRDWLVSRYTHGEHVDRASVQAFLEKHLPDKQQLERYHNRLLNGEELTILDSYSAHVDLKQGTRCVNVPSLDIFDAHVHDSIIKSNESLLSGGVWGAGKLRHQMDEKTGKVWLSDFQPMQTAVVDIDYFIAQRARFSTPQWQALLIRSMGYNPEKLSPQQEIWLLARLTLLVQPRVNLIELAPKGTGKSYVFSQLSKYGWLISGGVVTRAKLFYDMRYQTPGVITRYDAVVLDEVQTIRLQNEGEILGALKGFLESGEFRVMGFSGNSEAGFGLLANIPIGADGKPQTSTGRYGCYFSTLPSWLSGPDATALLDRFHGLIPGWELPRITHDLLVDGMGLRADYLSEVLHALRLRQEPLDFVQEFTHGDGDIRDLKAVQRLSAAFLRLIFPDLQCTGDEFRHYCMDPAIQLRALIRQQLSIMDPEYRSQVTDIECTL